MSFNSIFTGIITEFLKILVKTDNNFPKSQSTKIYSNDNSNSNHTSSFIEEFKPEDFEKALEKAWHNRDFEIEMYWKRSTYFWTFIGATFLGYFALIGSVGYHNFLKNSYYQIEVFIITIGVIFSWAWFFVNRGSKRWQENWENQIDEFEKLIGRPNYSIIFNKFNKTYYSVSRINQRVSLCVAIIWIILYFAYWIRFWQCYQNIFSILNDLVLLNWLSLLTIPLIIFFIIYLYTRAQSEVSNTANTIKNQLGGKKDFFFRRRKN